MTEDETMTIGEMCAAHGVTPRTLRFYEAKELISPIRDGQRRLYRPRDRARLKLILRGRRFGFSLDEMRELLDLYAPGDGQVTQLSATLEAAERHRAELAAKRDDLDAAIRELDKQMALVHRMLEEKGARRAAE